MPVHGRIWVPVGLPFGAVLEGGDTFELTFLNWDVLPVVHFIDEFASAQG